MRQWVVFWTGIGASHKLWGPQREFGYFVHEAPALDLSQVEARLKEISETERLQKATLTGITPL